MNNSDVGKVLAREVEIICPDADQLKTSIYPGVSIINTLPSSVYFSLTKLINKSILLTKILRQVIMAPFGPSLY